MENINKAEFDAFKRSKIEALGLPGWLMNANCPDCKQPLDWAGLDCLSLETGSKNFGNLSFNYICPFCSSATTRHFNAGCRTLLGFVFAMHPVIEAGKAAFRHEIPMEQNNLFNEFVEFKKKEQQEKT